MAETHYIDTVRGPVKMTNVHADGTCAGQYCIVHNPKPSHMDDWPLLFRDDRYIFERLCPHGVGHPEPSQHEFWEKTGRKYEAVHGCDGCCLESDMAKELYEMNWGSK